MDNIDDMKSIAQVIYESGWAAGYAKSFPKSFAKSAAKGYVRKYAKRYGKSYAEAYTEVYANIYAESYVVGMVKAAICIAQKRFQHVPEEWKALVQSATEEQLEEGLQRLADAPDLDSVFNGGGRS